MKGKVFGKTGMFFGMFFGIVLLSGCRNVKYVPVETVRVDTTYINKVQKDSIYQRDSIYVMEKGDTITVYRDRYLYRDKMVRDTVYINRTDSVQVPYPVERPLSRWQQVKLDVGGLAIGGIAVGVLVVVGWLVYRMRRRAVYTL